MTQLYCSQEQPDQIAAIVLCSNHTANKKKLICEAPIVNTAQGSSLLRAAQTTK